ncbi:hypothetical protein AB0E52_11465 [Micrococcus luteus]|uniref:hypothetical protein n=1 Tax=Micrococcaceae TaxID=1268 RepID=UPI00331F28B3
MATITIHEQDYRGASRQVARVEVTAEGIEVTDPEGYLDMSVPTPMIDRLDREQRRRVRHDEDPVLWAWNLPYLLRGPYLVAEREGDAPA